MRAFDTDMDKMDIFSNKAAVRAIIKERLKAMTACEMERQSAAACRRAVNSSAFQSAKTILVYSAMPGECDPAYIAEQARRRGKAVAYPKCENGTLGLYLAEPGQLKAGAYGIYEPDESCERIQAGCVDFAVIPGLAFDLDGGRLGRGGGYYDRLLGNMQAVKLGLCFNEQLLDRVPMAAHDCKVDMIAAEKWDILLIK